MHVRKGIALLIGVHYAVAPAAAPASESEERSVSVHPSTDRTQILEHIDGIFQAYVRRDREAIRRTHTPDWTGFQGPSVKIERGIDDYMVNAEKSLEHFYGTGYALLDTEVQLYGDVALVYYVARFDYRDGEGRRGSIPLRSLDVYRRENGAWNQCGSHITPIPSGGAWGADAAAPSREPGEVSAASSAPRTLTAHEQAELFSAREAVWRAWFTNDEAGLRAAIPDEAVAIDPGVAAWADRDEIFRRSADFVARGGRLLRLEFPETRVQAYGDTAILYTRFLFETERDGVRTLSEGRGTEVFVRRDGRWLNPGWHLAGEP